MARIDKALPNVPQDFLEEEEVVITEDNKNISDVAKAVAEGAFYNNGQSCCSVERIYVHSEVYGQFIEKFVDGNLYIAMLVQCFDTLDEFFVSPFRVSIIMGKNS